MALYWLVCKRGVCTEVFIQEAGYMALARMKAGLAGFEGQFVEAHELDAKTVKKLPRKFVGRALSAKEAAALLKRL